MDDVKTFTFGEAIAAAKDGKRIARMGWNGKGMFVFMQIPAEISIFETVPKMQSLPQSVKDEFLRRAELAKANPAVLPTSAYYISYSNQLAIVKPNNDINGWTPSGSDTLAEDWVILD